MLLVQHFTSINMGSNMPTTTKTAENSPKTTFSHPFSAPKDAKLPAFGLPNQESSLFAAIIGWTMVVTIAAFMLSPVSFVSGDEVQPLLMCLGLTGAALVYHRRGADNFVLCLKSLTVLVAFSTVFSLLVYAAGTLNAPLVDDFLASCDASMGVSAGKIINWVNERPGIAAAMKLAYFSAIPQTILVIVLLGFTNQTRVLNRFLLRFMLGGLITLGCFCFLPAMGTCASYDVAVPSHYTAILRDLTGLRNGSITLATWRTAEGLITFPSFHTIWAVLLISAFRKQYLFAPLLILNLLMIASTIPTGMHYATDILGGLAVSAIIIPVSNKIIR